MSNARDKANIPALNFSSTGIDDNATSTAITINSNERVGIGTTSAVGKLHIQSSDVNHIYLGGTSGDAYGLWVTDTGTNFNLGTWSGRETIKIDGSGNTIQFETDASERMRIDSSGNVGIGTSSPRMLQLIWKLVDNLMVCNYHN